LKNLPFIKLKQLVIREDFRGNETMALSNLKTFLTENPFTRLTHLVVPLYRASFVDLSTTGMLITFVQDHYALRDVKLSMNLMPVPDPLQHHGLGAIIAGIRKRGDCHLKDLLIATDANDPNPTHGFQFPAQIEIIQEFLLNIVYLESLSLSLEPIPSTILQTICTRNAATLQNLRIFDEYSDVDCSLLTCLKVAKTITVQSLNAGAIGINQIPSTLTKISIYGALQQADADHILFNLPNIQEIQLDGDGVEPFVTFDMLRRFNRSRRVNRLRVSEDCLATEEIVGILNYDPKNPEMLNIIWVGHCWYTFCLDWELNEAGFYTNNHSIYHH